MNNLPGIGPFLAVDLEHEFCSVMRVSPSQFQWAYQLFVGNVDKHLLKPNETEPFATAAAAEQRHQIGDEGIETTSHSPMWQLTKSQRVIWDGEGCCIRIQGIGLSVLQKTDSILAHQRSGHVVYAVAGGLMSDRRCRDLGRDL
jgi:hypothetical protein